MGWRDWGLCRVRTRDTTYSKGYGLRNHLTDLFIMLTVYYYNFQHNEQILLIIDDSNRDNYHISDTIDTCTTMQATELPQA